MAQTCRERVRVKQNSWTGFEVLLLGLCEEGLVEKN